MDARAGDKEALATLIDRHRDVLLALCRRSLGDPLLAEDAAHEAVLQAMLSLDSLRCPARFGPWLCGIGLNICRRWLRSRSAAPLSWDDLCGGRQVREIPDERPDPQDLAEEAELAARVRHAVDRLPRGQRAAVLLYYLSGLTCAETAAALGIEPGAVKTRLHKARGALRQTLWNVWQEEPMVSNEDTGLIEMRVIDVRRIPPEEAKEGVEQHVVVLETAGGDRRLLIWIGPPEATAMALQLEGIQTPRPYTYSFAASVLQAADARVREVQVNRLSEEVFYASVLVQAAGGKQMVDARPSDAINLALVTGAPIRVERDVLNQAGIPVGEAHPRLGDMPEDVSQGAAAIVADVQSRLRDPRVVQEPD